MSQIVTTPDGVEHEFPDGTSDDVIKGALKSYSQPQSSANSKPPAPQGYQSPSWLPGAGWLHKMSNVYDDAATLGTADPATATVGSLLRSAGIANATPDTATLRAQTAQNRTDVGPIASGAADLAGYAVGPGVIGGGEKLAALAGGKLLARMGGSAVEGALASGGGTLGHGGSLGEAGQAATVGGLIGAVTGALPGGRGPRPTTPTSEALQSTASGMYAPLKGKTYVGSDVANAVDKVTTGMEAGDAVSMGPNLADARDRISREAAARGTVTANDVAKFQRELRAAAGNNDTRQAIAKQYVDALNKGVGSQTAADIGAANRASNIAKTGSDIEGWTANPAGAPAAVKSALENNPNFYKTQPGLFDVLSKVGQKANDPSLLTKLRDYTIRGAVGGGLGYGAGYALGGNPGQSAVEGAMTGVIAPHVIKAAGNMPIKNALLAAQHLNATGVPVSPGVYTPQWLQIPGMLARQGGYAAGATGGL